MANEDAGPKAADAKGAELPKCGIIMPISDTDGYEPGHWGEVLAILIDAVRTEFETTLVSQADEVAIIQKTIVQNLYENELVICDISSKNPNVMFELGMRLTFDRPTVIVHDDHTALNFDTSVIEHIKYPKDLRFPDIVKFKDDLRRKCKATLKAASDPDYSPFLKHFGNYQISKLPTKSVSQDQFIVERIEDLSKQVGLLRKETRQTIKAERPITENFAQRIPYWKDTLGDMEIYPANDSDCIHLSTFLKEQFPDLPQQILFRDGQTFVRIDTGSTRMNTVPLGEVQEAIVHFFQTRASSTTFGAFA